MRYDDLIKRLQKSLNEKGASLSIDGDPGPRTRAALDKAIVEIKLKKLGISPVPSGKDDYFGAPWVFANIDLLGRNEKDPLLNARYTPEWPLEGLPHYKTLSGNTYAWCSVRANADRRKVGVKGTDSAAAASWSRWGRDCIFWFGAALPIKHRKGGRHICDFLYWINESKRIAATLDGNRGDKFCVAETDLSDRGDILMPGPKWPIGYPDGRIVTMAEAISRYPFLRVGSSGGSTR